MKHIVAIFVACIFPALLAGCGGNLKCGAGTVDQDGVCVPSGPREEVVSECGAGTERVGGTCVVIGASDVGSADSGVCTPDCEGKECGLDGCGGFCSPCTDDAKPFCDLATSTCIALDCDPFCPIGSQCGDDGCGGTCGECPDDLPFCSPDNTCAQVCTPDCDEKVCGDDGCGGSCGECSGDESCNTGGSCVPPSWVCAPGSFADGQICDCECGAPDPDCDDPAVEGTLAANCLNYQTCDAQGTCQDTVPAEWTCDPARYGEGGTCDCGCGVIDSDCADSNLPVAGCMGSDICNSDGTCGECVPSCDGKTCGNDGCGGNCGACDDPNAPFCNGNQCVSACDPTPLRCETNTCGDDGCGGSCGTCGAGEECVAGNCEVAVDPASCAGNCGGVAASGCSCAPDCEAAGSCCLDYLDICPVVCTPDCNNRQCGDDGCGGSCGMCNDANFPTCNAMTGQCEAACVPDCTNKNCGDDGCGGSCGMCNDPNFPMCDMNQGRCVDPNCTPECTAAECGDDGCGGLCGTCGAGDKCFEAERLCAPETWVCDASLYDDGFCQCGCGGPDTDCAMSMPPVSGCPDTVSCDMTTGTCDMPRCRADAQCVVGELCVGAYYEGGRRLSGQCELKVPTMFGAPGAACLTADDCDSGICSDEICRAHCATDADCNGVDELCLVAEPEDPAYITENLTSIAGWAGVCQVVPGSGTPCLTNMDCVVPGEECLAFLDGDTLGVRYMCSEVDPLEVNAPCDLNPLCPPGLHCSQTSLETSCVKPCPGGQIECQMGEVCSPLTINDRGTPSTTDDVIIQVCLP